MSEEKPGSQKPRPVWTARGAIARTARAQGLHLSRLDLSRLVQSTVDVRDARTAIGHEEPSEIPFTHVWDDVVALYKSGLHPAIALHVMHRGRPVVDRVIGHVENEPDGLPATGPAATPDTLFNLFSASKIVTATLVHALVEDGLLNLDRPVADVLPGMSRKGKSQICLRHLLNHTAGIPDMPQGFDLQSAMDAGAMPLEALYDLPLQSQPGLRVAYHPVTGWFLVQAMIEQVTGKDLRTALNDRVLAPLGFERMNYGVAAHETGLVAKHALTGPPVPSLMSDIFERSIGVNLDQAVPLTNGDQFLTTPLPSANVIGAPREVSRFMQMLLNGGEIDGVRVLSRGAVRRAITEVTPRQFDATFGFPMRYGLGVMMGGRRFSLFGLNTPGAFGHLGLSTVVVYADPARELCVSFLNTGKPMLAPGMIRWYWALQRIANMVPRRPRVF